MKKVVHLVNLVPTISEVPDNWMQCSISGEFRPLMEFGSDGISTYDRINCDRTYNMKHDDCVLLKSLTTDIMNSDTYKNMCKKLQLENDLIENSISIQSMIDSLTELQKTSPTARLIITQDGYYADGNFADIFHPVEHKKFKGFYEIGNSTQDY